MTDILDINLGSAEQNGKDGDTTRVALGKANTNFAALNAGKLDTEQGTADKLSVTGGLTVAGGVLTDGITATGTAYANGGLDSKGSVTIRKPDGSVAIGVDPATGNLNTNYDVHVGAALQVVKTATFFNGQADNTPTPAGIFLNGNGTGGVYVYPQLEPGDYTPAPFAGDAGIMTRTSTQSLFIGVPAPSLNGIRFTATGLGFYGADLNFTGRPKFAGATPWDSANLVTPVDTGTAATTKAGRTALGMGLTLIKRITTPYGTPVTLMNFNNVFSSEFDSYEVVLNLVCVAATSVNGSVNNAVNIGVRYSFDGSTLDSSAVYAAQNDYTFYNDTTVITNGLNGVQQSYAPLGTIQSCTYTQTSTDVRRQTMNAFINIIEDGFGGRYFSARVNTVQANGSNNSARLFQRWEVVHGQAGATAITPATGFSIVIPNVFGTVQGIAGTVSVYGRRNGT